MPPASTPATVENLFMCHSDLPSAVTCGLYSYVVFYTLLVINHVILGVNTIGKYPNFMQIRNYIFEILIKFQN